MNKAAELYLWYQNRAAIGAFLVDGKTEYDWSKGCAVCGTDSRQGDVLHTSISRPVKRAVNLLNTKQIVLHTRCVELFDTRSLRVCSVLRKGGSVIDDVVQVIPQITLPPMLPTTTGKTTEASCAHCGRDGHYNIPHVELDAHYKREDVLKLVDFDKPQIVATWECFGPSRKAPRPPFYRVIVAQPRPVVTAAAAEVIRGLVGKAAYFWPVVLE